MKHFSIQLLELPLIVFYACELLYPLISLVSTPMFSEFLCNALIVLSLIFVILSRKKGIRLFPWLLAGACLLAFIITGQVYPEYRNLIYKDYNIWNTVFSPRNGMMLMLILSLINDPKEIRKSLQVSAIFVWAAYTIRSLSRVGLSQISGYNHTYGYAFLFVSIIYTMSYFTQRSKVHLGIALISLFQILMYASRTAILAYVVFLAIYVLCYDNSKKLHWKKQLFIILGCILLFVVTSDVFLNFLSIIVKKMGLSSRIIDSFLSRDIQLDGGRERSYLLAAELLKEHPWGLGVFWDRYYCEYTYVHSFLFEVLLDFGWLIGGFILFALARNIIIILRSDEKEWKALLILYFSLSMVRLTLSYSFWLDNNFWGMIAVIMGYNYFTKRKKRMNSKNI